MSEEKTAIESLMGERGHLRTSHEMLKAALEIESRDDSFVPFYIATANYMEAGMGRLDAQDVRMLSRLAEKLGNMSDDEKEIIAEVHRRLDGNREHLKKFLTCRDALVADETDQKNIANFESVSNAYIDYIHNSMGHHAPSTDIAIKLFDDNDWDDIADIDPEYFSGEQKLYVTQLAVRPDSVPLGKEAAEYVAEYRRDLEE
jgi:hypothetical protein